MQLYKIEEGIVSDASCDTTWDGVTSIVALCDSEDQALDLARLYDEGEITYDNAQWSGKTIAALMYQPT